MFPEWMKEDDTKIIGKTKENNFYYKIKEKIIKIYKKLIKR
jgi:hypothetical protein